MRTDLKNKLWMVGLVVAILVSLTFFIQWKSHKGLRDYIEPEHLESRTVRESETPGLREEFSLTTEVGVPASLNLNLKLLGTVVDSQSTVVVDSPSMAFILDLDSGELRFCKLDEKVFGARVVSIALGKVVLEKDGAKQELFIEGGGRSTGGYDAFEVTPDSPGEIIISKSYLKSQIGKANELFSKIKIFPVTDRLTKRLKGYRIDNVPSGSVVEQAGIRSGDIVYSVQGQKIESAEDVLRIFNSVKNESNIDVTLLRDGKVVRLRYEIED